MLKFLKISGVIIVIALIALFTLTALKQDQKFDAPYPKVRALSDSNVIARGEKIVFGPGHCASCHGSADMEDEILKGNNVPLSGGRIFPLPIGNLYAKNLTPDPTGIGNVSDSAIARALRYGVGSDGRALFDLMAFHHTSDSDLVAIISFLRNQPPVKNQVPANTFTPMGKVVKAFLLKPVSPTETVLESIKPDTTARYGAYLANNVANCRGCHTNRDLQSGEFIGKEYAGGLEMESPSDTATWIVTSPNLTPDPSGRITGWTLGEFVQRFRLGPVIPQSHMPWGSYSKMSDDELKAIYNYLQTLKPVNNVINEPVRLKTED